MKRKMQFDHPQIKGVYVISDQRTSLESHPIPPHLNPTGRRTIILSPNVSLSELGRTCNTFIRLSVKPITIHPNYVCSTSMTMTSARGIRVSSLDQVRTPILPSGARHYEYICDNNADPLNCVVVREYW